MNKTFYAILSLVFIFFNQSCSQKQAPDELLNPPADAVTPVSITHPVMGGMSETVEVSAVSSFLLRTYAKASANGYLQTANVHLGQFVVKGKTLFTIKTKEAQALGNTINQLDSSLHFEGVISIKSPGTGYITQLTYTSGNYVQDGEQLAEVTDNNSFVFILNLPYELKPLLPNNKILQLHLPDSTVITGYLEASLPVLDSVSQAQRCIIKVKADREIPENLIARIRLIKSQKINTVSLLKGAVLSNEVQNEFWIMKMINDSIAVKMTVQKGIETKDAVEILSPTLAKTDRILLTGNYGLADTAKVKVVER